MKKMTLALLTGIAALTLGGCGSGDSGKDAKDDGKLVISTFGLSEDIVKSDVMAPFEKEFSAKVTLEVGNSADRYMKLLNNPNAAIDIIELAQGNAVSANEDDLFLELDESKIENVANLTDGAREIFDAGAGVPYTLNSVGIIYNKEKAGKEIKEWADLWDESLKGKISIPEITSTAGIPMMYLASDVAGVDIASDNGEAAFKEIEKLSPNIVKTYSKSSDLANMFQSGEIAVAVVSDFAVDIIKGADEDVTYLVPESGTYANYNTINIPKNSKNTDLAYKYINHRISQEVQTQTASSLNESPTNSTVELADDVIGNMTYGAVADRAKNIDYTFVNKQLDSWIDQWNKLLNQ
ncbi:ABC transporter substrate-binding protein [Vagococcus acidifermentans]|uniref:Spermidine/putrescine ABC transporter substrate-binding protein n=1 Tax=Vagococcus acidifermentans TaxID=564710 RepID=A0A430ANQ0_9ENTE|nr:ABC transporter substrate-binding protein [Vagococcus acidifermentans]RSU09527.1 spermidine/putrescine ABC transporter substrate-binding protein [Vagococcus acidifermentans]